MYDSLWRWSLFSQTPVSLLVMHDVDHVWSRAISVTCLSDILWGKPSTALERRNHYMLVQMSKWCIALVYICMYVYISKYIHIYIYRERERCAYTNTPIYINTQCTCISTYIRTHTYTHIHIHSITYHYITLHYTTLHYITIHTYIHMYVPYIYTRKTHL